jgi:hypothetical protein
MITITREKTYADKLRSYNVILDGTKIGSIKQGETKTFDTRPGPHKLLLKIDWALSNELQFNGDAQFQCRNVAKGLQVLLAILYTTIWSNRYITLTQL